MIRITRKENNHIIEIFTHPKGVTLLESLRNQGHPLEAPCSGQGLCGKCKVQILSGNDDRWSAEELSCLSNEEREGGWRLACHYEPKEDISFTWEKNPTWAAQEDSFVFLKSQESHNTESHNAELSSSQELGIAIDIGTTTVVASLVALNNGLVLNEAYAINPQKQFGLDVMSRIAYQDQNQEGNEILKSAICTCLKDLIQTLLEESQREPQQIHQVTIVGNTPMLHFVLGLSAAKLGKAPYLSLVEGLTATDTVTLGIGTLPKKPVYLLPPIKAFVGSDISAGLLASDIMNRKGNVLLIDIGTNGEIVLKTEQGLFCCSCAAGPAFEGANISCGMRATGGAIESMELDAHGHLKIETIGNHPTQGICGSGVLDVISLLAENKLLGKTGRLKSSEDVPSAFTHLLSENERGRYFLLDERNPAIRLYQSDVRQIQLAKGAIRSGVEALLQHQHIKPEAISEVLIAGQFGSHIKERSLIKSGMLPSAFGNKVTYIGNSAKKGAELCLTNPAAMEKIGTIAKATEYIELSTLQGYDRLFVSCLNFDEKEVSL